MRALYMRAHAGRSLVKEFYPISYEISMAEKHLMPPAPRFSS
jgi:hypothetical protein